MVELWHDLPQSLQEGYMEHIMYLYQISGECQLVGNWFYPCFDLKRPNIPQSQLSFQSKLHNVLPRHNLEEYLIPHLKFEGFPHVICITSFSFLSCLYSFLYNLHLFSGNLYQFWINQSLIPYFFSTYKSTTPPFIQGFIGSHSHNSLIVVIVGKIYQWQVIFLITIKIQHI